MAKSKTPTPTTTPAATSALTLKQLLASFTKKRVEQVSDLGVKEHLTGVLAMVTGLARPFLATANNAAAVRELAQLAEAGVTEAKVLALGEGALALMDKVAERDSLEASFHVSVHDASEQDAAVLKLSAAMTSRLRGQFGNTSSELERYAAKPLGRLSHAKKKAPKNTVTKT